MHYPSALVYKKVISHFLSAQTAPLSPKMANFGKLCGNAYLIPKLMEQTLVIIKPSAIARPLSGKIINRFVEKGLIISGIKMMQLDDNILREHYAHLVDKPFFPSLLRSMKATPVIVMCLSGKDAVSTVRAMTGATNCRNAAPGTIRGDYGMSSQENIVHASDSVDNAAIEVKRFFAQSEIFDYQLPAIGAVYAPDELD